MSKVVIVDYGIGNTFSVFNALVWTGGAPILSDDPKIIAEADRVIMPGVGAFSEAMKNIRASGIDDAIFEFISSGRPFLGICLGMQILMDESYELGFHKGLGLVPGHVLRLPKQSDRGRIIKVPHLGWAKVSSCSDSANQDMQLINNICGHYYYFAHSYSCMPKNNEHLLMDIDFHGIEIAAMIGFKNIIGVQFHPECSGASGLSFFRRFLNI